MFPSLDVRSLFKAIKKHNRKKSIGGNIFSLLTLIWCVPSEFVNYTLKAVLIPPPFPQLIFKKENYNTNTDFILLTCFVFHMIQMKITNFDTFNPLSANPTKWLNTLKQFIGNLPTNCLSVFDHFVGLALKGLICGFHELLLPNSYLVLPGCVWDWSIFTCYLIFHVIRFVIFFVYCSEVRGFNSIKKDSHASNMRKQKHWKKSLSL